jgi:hypothetical protein
MNTLDVILIIVAVLAITFAVLMYLQNERTKRLRGQFGPEYDRLVRDRGNNRKAEAELLKRQKRLERLHIRELNQAEIDRFSNSWRAIQTQFVDTPREAVAQADRLIRDVMATRGYPMIDFEQCVDDVSVDHPHVVENYRRAHDIAVRDSKGQANTEDLRQAMVHYRALFEDLLTTRSDQFHEVTR